MTSLLLLDVIFVRFACIPSREWGKYSTFARGIVGRNEDGTLTAFGCHLMGGVTEGGIPTPPIGGASRRLSSTSNDGGWKRMTKPPADDTTGTFIVDLYKWYGKEGRVWKRHHRESS